METKIGSKNIIARCSHKSSIINYYTRSNKGRTYIGNSRIIKGRFIISPQLVIFIKYKLKKYNAA